MPEFEAESYRELEVYVYKVSSARYHSSAIRLNSSYTVLLHEFRQWSMARGDSQIQIYTSLTLDP